MRISTFYQFQKQGDLINQQYEQMNKLYAQSGGKKIQSSSEDPVLASQIKANENYIQSINNYYNNGVLAQNRARLFSTSIQNSISIIGDVKNLITKAQSGTLSDSNESMAEQLQGDLTMLLTYANTQDADGNYIFSGFNTNTPPYVEVNGSYQYQGGYTSAVIDIGPNASAVYYESGFNIFSDIYTGNGKFTVTADDANTGSASTSPGSVVNTATYVPDTYTLTFLTNSAGQKVYQIVGATSGQVIPPPPATMSPDDAPVYNPKSDITFNGMSFNVDGNPSAGDSFVIAPSSQENVFNAIQDLMDLMKSPPANKAIYDQKLTQLSATFSQISTHMTTYLTQVGTRSQAVDEQVKTNDTILTNSTIALSGLQDSDIVAVYSALAQKSVALQATYSGYAKLQETLLALLKL